MKNTLLLKCFEDSARYQPWFNDWRRRFFTLTTIGLAQYRSLYDLIDQYQIGEVIIADHQRHALKCFYRTPSYGNGLWHQALMKAGWTEKYLTPGPEGYSHPLLLAEKLALVKPNLDIAYINTDAFTWHPTVIWAKFQGTIRVMDLYQWHSFCHSLDPMAPPGVGYFDMPETTRQVVDNLEKDEKALAAAREAKLVPDSSTVIMDKARYFFINTTLYHPKSFYQYNLQHYNPVPGDTIELNFPLEPAEDLEMAFVQLEELWTKVTDRTELYLGVENQAGLDRLWSVLTSRYKTRLYTRDPLTISPAGINMMTDLDHPIISKYPGYHEHKRRRQQFSNGVFND